MPGFRESDLLRSIAERSRDLAGLHDAIEVGPGDDCAVLRARGHLLLTVDQLVVGRHVDEHASIDQIARKAIARSVSDIAAMGGSPCWALATALLPAGYRHADGLFDAMASWARSWHCPLVGGDIASGPGPLALTVTVAGVPHAARGPVLRSQARAGDGVYVTGSIGNSLASGWHIDFEPRIAEGDWLCEALGERLGAMIDLSDGLGRDAGRLAEASGVSIELDGARIPLRGGAVDVLTAAGEGEDHELLFTARGEVPGVCPATGTPITRIGSVSPRGRQGSTCTLVVDGRAIDASELGFDH